MARWKTCLSQPQHLSSQLAPSDSLEQRVVSIGIWLPQRKLALAPVRPAGGQCVEARDAEVDGRLGLMLGAAPHHVKHGGELPTGRYQLRVQRAADRAFMATYMQSGEYNSRPIHEGTYIFIDVQHGQESPSPQVRQNRMIVHEPLVPVRQTRMLRNRIPAHKLQQAAADPLGDPLHRQQQLKVSRPCIKHVPEQMGILVGVIFTIIFKASINSSIPTEVSGSQRSWVATDPVKPSMA